MLGIDPRKVRQVIVEARMSDADDDAAGCEAGFGRTACNVRGREALLSGLANIIRDLEEEEQIVLMALAWVGRHTYSPAEWDQALSEAGHAYNSRTADYLTSLPRLGDYLEEGLAAIGNG